MSKLKAKSHNEFEDMVYYIIHVMNHPESYESDDKVRATDLLQVIVHDILQVQRKKDDNTEPLLTAGYKTLAAISNEVN